MSLPPDYFSLASNFLDLSESIITQMIKSGNPAGSFISSDPKETLEERHKESVRWSDQNVAIPLLFNFYHGLELTLKGMLSPIGKIPKEKSHKLSYLLEVLENNSEVNSNFSTIVKKYSGIDNQFSPLFKKNALTGDQFYQIFKYPELSQEKQFDFSSIHHQEEISLDMFIELKDNIGEIHRLKEQWWQENRHLSNY
ncbi:MAG: hypothetical protein JKY48_08795 [Flavobacteriales bacterium]|nr:hypothetical protein [Flavobacteriales bacterium]